MQRGQHGCTVEYQLLLDQIEKLRVQLFPRFRAVRPLDLRLDLSRPARVAWISPTVFVVQQVHESIVLRLRLGGRDIQALAACQLDAGNHKM